MRMLKPRLATASRTSAPAAQRFERQGSTARGYTYKWQQESKRFLAEHPLCQCPECDEGRKRVTPATVVDHIVPHKGDQKLFWRRSNWQAMSKPCHDTKTAREDGGFGRPTQ